MAGIRIETTQAVRKRARKACIEDDLTYEELLERLLAWRAANTEDWEQFLDHDGTRGRRSAGADP